MATEMMGLLHRLLLFAVILDPQPFRIRGVIHCHSDDAPIGPLVGGSGQDKALGIQCPPQPTLDVLHCHTNVVLGESQFNQFEHDGVICIGFVGIGHFGAI